MDRGDGEKTMVHTHAHEAYPSHTIHPYWIHHETRRRTRSVSYAEFADSAGAHRSLMQGDSILVPIPEWDYYHTDVDGVVHTLGVVIELQRTCT